MKQNYLSGDLGPFDSATAYSFCRLCPPLEVADGPSSPNYLALPSPDCPYPIDSSQLAPIAHAYLVHHLRRLIYRPEALQ